MMLNRHITLVRWKNLFVMMVLKNGFNTGWVNWNGSMTVRFIQVIGLMDRCLAKEPCINLIKMYIKVNFWMAKQMVMELSRALMVKFILVTGRMIKPLVKVSKYNLMVAVSRELLRILRNMDMVSLSGKITRFMMDNGLKIYLKVRDHIHGVTAEHMLDNGITTRCMVRAKWLA